MFNLDYESRMKVWADFRSSLDLCADPIAEVVEFYSSAPLVSIATDPYDKTTWLTPWELILENQYCGFNIVLGMCYSLQLTERFSGDVFEIHIIIDKEKCTTYYTLSINQQQLIGWNDGEIFTENFPNLRDSQMSYHMQPQH